MTSLPQSLCLTVIVPRCLSVSVASDRAQTLVWSGCIQSATLEVLNLAMVGGGLGEDGDGGAHWVVMIHLTCRQKIKLMGNPPHHSPTTYHGQNLNKKVHFEAIRIASRHGLA